MPAPEHVHFGSRLRYWRRVAGLTQAQLGRWLAYHHSFISRLETGHRWPSRALAARCDELFDTGGELVNQWRRAERERRASAGTAGGRRGWRPGPGGCDDRPDKGTDGLPRLGPRSGGTAAAGVQRRRVGRCP